MRQAEERVPAVPSLRTLERRLKVLREAGVLQAHQRMGRQNKFGVEQRSWWSTNEYRVNFHRIIRDGACRPFDFFDAQSSGDQAQAVVDEPAGQPTAELTARTSRSTITWTEERDVGSHSAAPKSTDKAWSLAGAAKLEDWRSRHHPKSEPVQLGLICGLLQRLLADGWSRADVVEATAYWQRRRLGNRGLQSVGAVYVSEIEDWLGRLVTSPATREQFDQVLSTAHSPNLEECCLLLEYMEHWDDVIPIQTRARALSIVAANTEFEEIRDTARSIIEAWAWSRDDYQIVPWRTWLVLMRSLSSHVRYLGDGKMWDAAMAYGPPSDLGDVPAHALGQHFATWLDEWVTRESLTSNTPAATSRRAGTGARGISAG